MKKQYRSSIIENHKITTIFFFYGVPLKGYIASYVIFSSTGRRPASLCHGLLSVVCPSVC